MSGPAPESSRLGAPTRLLVAACVAGIAVQVGARALFAWAGALPAGLGEPIESVLQASSRTMLFAFSFLGINAVPLGLFALVAVLQPGLCFRRAAGRRGLRGLWLVLAWALLLLNEIFFDVNGWVALAGWGTLPVGVALAHVGAPLGRWPRALAWGLLVIAVASAAPSRPDAFAVLVWGAWLLAVLGWAPRVLLPADRTLLVAAGTAGVQLLVTTRDLVALALLALLLVAVVGGGVAAHRRLRRRGSRLVWGVWPVAALVFAVALSRLDATAGSLFDHGGRAIGEGLAYSFCERAEAGRIYAAVPACATGSPGCAEGVLAEYDASDLREIGRHRFFGEDFHGRLEQAVCLDDAVQIGMCCTQGAGIDDEATVTWRPETPDRTTRNPPDASARRLAVDTENDAIFYVGNDVRRVDRATGASRRVGHAIYGDADPAADLPWWARGVFIGEWDGFHRGRNTLVVAEFVRGSTLWELDLESFEARSEIRVHNGGIIGFAVDEELGRIYVSGLFGVEAWEIDPPRLVARRRTGTLARRPVVDAARDLVYVPTTIAGRIEVFDRRTLARLGAIPIGLETRNAHLTGDGRWLLASGSRAHYVWDAAELAARLRGDGGETP